MSLGPGATLLEIDADDLGPEGTLGPLALDQAIDGLAMRQVIALRLHPTETAKAEAIVRAERVVEQIRLGLVVRHLLPGTSYVEVDAESHGVPVAPFRDRRFLLPHQDGGHCSFLTPSRLDCSDMRPEERLYSSSIYWRRPSHKMYQGFLVTNPGASIGATYYYDALALLAEAFACLHGRRPSSVPELARFELENLRKSKALQWCHGSRYFTLGAFLGSKEAAHHVSPSGPRAESEFWPAQYLHIPKLVDLADNCPCGICDGPGARLLCDACCRTLGRTWPQVRSTYETAVVAERHDLLLASNLTLYHAAESHSSRTLVPLSIVTDAPEGPAYERWLAAQWRVGSRIDDTALAPLLTT
jgi:hypothetical protein